MVKFLIKLILFAIAVYLAAMFVPGIEIAGVKGAIITSIVLGLLNTFVKPLVKLLTLPVNLLTLGLFSLVINAGMVLLCEHIVPNSIVVSGFMPALFYSIVLMVVTWVLNFIFLND